jgi:hypothetical protein
MKANPNLATDETRTEHGRKNSLIRVYSVFNPWPKSGLPTWCLGVLVVCIFALTSAAQQYATPWFKIAGGGGMQSTGGVYALSGTIGQVDTGRVAATNAYRIEAGFWAVAIQQLGYPELSIMQSGTNAIVSWVTAESGLILQQTLELAIPTAWADSGLTVTTNATTNLVTVPLNPAMKTFFRLRRL